MNDIEELIDRSIDPSTVRVDGTITIPPSFGVYAVVDADSDNVRYRFGSHPVRMHELEDKFDTCELEYLFLSMADAAAVTSALNRRSDD